jgi:methionyl-tRNA formyltransferase
MKILLLGNGPLAAQAVDIVRESGDELVGAVLHPPDAGGARRDEILERAELAPEAVVDGSELDDPAVLEELSALGADAALSVKFGYILRPSFLALFPDRIVNLHTSLLPYNRGAFPNVWAILDKTPAGVTVHVVDRGVDTGPILGQVEVPIFAWDTGASLYERLDSVAVHLLREIWPDVSAGRLLPREQSGPGTTHRVADVAAIDPIDMAASYVASDLIDLLRARTFPDHRGAFFLAPDGRRVYLRLTLEPEPEPEPESEVEA